MSQLNKILDYIKAMGYSPEKDYPCLFEQYQRFLAAKPQAGKRILHATPLFSNVIPKLLPLMASGAELVVSSPPNITMDAAAVRFLESLGVTCTATVDAAEKFDFVLDCTGSYAHLAMNIGAVELTKSGRDYYQETQHACVLVDDSKIKLIEDMLGTSDGLIRALNQLGYTVNNKNVMLFGYGKVGKGVYLRLKNEGAHVNLVDIARPSDSIEHFIAAADKTAVQKQAKACDFIITATGVRQLIETSYDIGYFKNGPTLVNIGAEDEYGPSFAEEEILNQKAPVNFVLDEPTQLKYLDATFALHNEGTVQLLDESLPPGIHKPRFIDERKFLAISAEAGIDIDSLTDTEE